MKVKDLFHWKVGILTVLIVGLVLLAGFGCEADEPAVDEPEVDEPEVDEPVTDDDYDVEEFELVMAGGPEGAVTNTLYSMMVEDWLNELDYMSGGFTGSTPDASVMGLVGGRYNVAQSISNITGAAIDGSYFFEDVGEQTGFQNLVTFFPQSTTIIVWEDSDIYSIEDLIGKRVAGGPRGGATHLVNLQILEAMGIDEEDISMEFLGFPDAQQQMLDGHLDAIMYGTTTYPLPGVMQVLATDNVRFLELDEDVIDTLAAEHTGLDKVGIPEGVYELYDGSTNEFVPGVGGYLHLMVREDFPEEVAYDMAKVSVENFGRYQENIGAFARLEVDTFATEVPGIEFHPGALKLFQEKGFIE